MAEQNLRSALHELANAVQPANLLEDVRRVARARRLRRRLGLGLASVVVLGAGVISARSVMSAAHRVQPAASAMGCARASATVRSSEHMIFLDRGHIFDAPVTDLSDARQLTPPQPAAGSLTPRPVQAMTASPTGSGIAWWDGKQLAVTRGDGQTEVVQKTYKYVSGMSWTPDGLRLYYSLYDPIFGRGHHERYHYNLYVYDLAGTTPHGKRVLGGAGLALPSVSPDGDHIAAIPIHTGPPYQGPGVQLLLLDPATGERTTLLSGTHLLGSQVAWSPDGRLIAAAEATSPPSAHYFKSRIVVLSVDHPSAQPVVAAADKEKYALTAPAWRTDNELWFTAQAAPTNWDDNRGPQPDPQTDICSVTRVNGGRYSQPVARTDTPDRQEQSISFVPARAFDQWD